MSNNWMLRPVSGPKQNPCNVLQIFNDAKICSEKSVSI